MLGGWEESEILEGAEVLKENWDCPSQYQNQSQKFIFQSLILDFKCF